jgi:putative endonuclease
LQARGCRFDAGSQYLETTEHFVYVLVSLKDGNAYVGISNNLLRRYYQHAEGWVTSTRERRPFVMVYWESCQDRAEAQVREKWLKSPEAAGFKTNL